MGEFSPIHWLILIAVIVLLFGGRRIPEVMRGMGEGIRNFKDGMRGDSSVAATSVTPVPPPTVINPAPPVSTAPPPTVHENK